MPYVVPQAPPEVIPKFRARIKSQALPGMAPKPNQVSKYYHVPYLAIAISQEKLFTNEQKGLFLGGGGKGPPKRRPKGLKPPPFPLPNSWLTYRKYLYHLVPAGFTGT